MYLPYLAAFVCANERYFVEAFILKAVHCENHVTVWRVTIGADVNPLVDDLSQVAAEGWVVFDNAFEGLFPEDRGVHDFVIAHEEANDATLVLNRDIGRLWWPL